MPHQMIKSSKGRKNKLEGRMRPAGLTLAMSDLVHNSFGLGGCKFPISQPLATLLSGMSKLRPPSFFYSVGHGTFCKYE